LFLLIEMFVIEQLSLDRVSLPSPDRRAAEPSKVLLTFCATATGAVVSLIVHQR